MQIPREQAEKLKRYFMNADPFLWGVLESRNKKERLMELRRQGLLQSYSESSTATYTKINQDLLVEVGIEGVVEGIVVPRVTAAFDPGVLGYFRRCWEQGQQPDMKYLVGHGLHRTRRLGDKQKDMYALEGFRIDDQEIGMADSVAGRKDLAQIFVQINAQHHFVERWTVFAGLWFEEIEPLLHPTRDSTSEGSPE